MKAGYTEEDFARGVKNPYFEKLNRKTEVAVRHETYRLFQEIGSQNGVPAEVIMNRCLEDYAKMLTENE
jgi:hypothetical protein